MRPQPPERTRRFGSLLAGEELDRKANWAIWLDEVVDVGRDPLRIAGLDHDVGHRVRLGDEVEPSPTDPQSPPRSAGQSVGSAQRLSAWSVHPTLRSFR